MNEPQSDYQYHQNPFKGEANRSCENDNHRKQRTKEEPTKKRQQRRKRQRDRKRKRDENQEKRHDQGKRGGNRNFQNKRQCRGQRKRYFVNDDHNAQHRVDMNYNRQMEAQESINYYSQNNESFMENRARPFDIDENRVRNVAVAQSPLPQREHSNGGAPRQPSYNERSDTANGNVAMPNVVENIKDVVLNIKTEKKDDAPKKDDSSSSSTSDSDESLVDSATTRLHNVVNSVISANPLKIPHQPKIDIKKEKSSSSSDTSSDSSSDTDSEPQKQKSAPDKTPSAKKNSSEEEVICLGKMERKENLVDDEDEDMPLPMEDEKICFLCEKPGHVAFQCFMVCKNCNGQYHGLKNCPEPPNISLVLQFFMQFCMDQVCKYNPDGKFNLDGYQQINPQLFTNYEGSVESMRNSNTMSRKRRNSNDAGSSVSKASRKHYEESSSEESETSSDENRKRKSKRKSKSVSDFDLPQQMPFTPAAYNAALPFAFNPSAMVNPAMNPLLAFGQMMGYNNPPLKRSGKSKKK